MTSVNTEILDSITGRALDLQRLTAGQLRDAARFLNELEGDIVAQIAKIDPTGIAAPSRQAARLEKLLSQVKETIRAAYRGESTRLIGELRELADVETTFAGSSINKALGFDFITTSITRGQLAAIVDGVLIEGAPVSDWLSRQAGDTLQRFTDAMRLGIAEGQTNASLIRAVRGGTQNGSPVQGFMEISRRNAESLVRSATQAVSQKSRQSLYEGNEDIVKSLQWVSTIDLRTTVLCAVRDGLTYTVDTHEPIGHDIPWGGGPGNLHWGALVEDTLIRTKAGLVPIQFIKVGDLVLTHLGRWKAVTDTKCKPLQGGVVRVVNMKSGGVLRATDDHPIFSGGWKFAGSLKVGDDLRSDAYRMEEVIRACGLVAAKPEYGPALTDKGCVAVKRALKLVAPDIGFKCASNIWAGEVENRAIKMILRDPIAIQRDQSFRHHMLSVAHVLSEVGRNRLGDLVSVIVSEGDSTKAGAVKVKAVGAFGGKSLGDSFRNLTWVVNLHAQRCLSILGVGFFGLAKSPMVSAGRVGNGSAGVVDAGLFGFVADSQAMPLGITRQNAVGESFLPLNSAKGKPVGDMPPVDDVCKSGIEFGHDVVLSLGLQTYSGLVYDLEVETDASYIANGIAVSNCRSTSVPVLKSFRELGFDIDEVPVSTRAGMDGQVAADTTFEGWLSRRDVAEQNDKLGVGRAQLWRDGKIKFRDLVDGNGRELTLAELRAKTGGAFSEAAGSPNKASWVDSVTKFRATDAAIKGAKEISDVVSMDDLVSSMTGGLLDSSSQADVSIKANSLFFTAKGGGISDISRRIDLVEKIAEHSIFQLEKSAQGAGAGKAVLKGSVDLYKNIGIKEVRLNANIDVGGYAWAKYGFAPTDDTIGEVIDRFRRSANSNLSIPEKELPALMKILEPRNKDAFWALSDSKWGKEVMLGSNWNGKLDLTDSQSMKRFDAYVGK